MNTIKRKENSLVRLKRWIKFLINYSNERLHGLDFSMVYVGSLQREISDFHGYSMTDADEMKRMLRMLPVDPKAVSFLDVGCGKGMCVRCAAELGFQKAAGLDLDGHLLNIARENLNRLDINAELIQANAVDFTRYAEFDVFYFYNPFGEPIFEQVIQKIKKSQQKRPREIWIVYYHPVFGDLFEKAGFQRKQETKDRSRDTITHFFYLPNGAEQTGGGASGQYDT